MENVRGVSHGAYVSDDAIALFLLSTTTTATTTTTTLGSSRACRREPRIHAQTRTHARARSAREPRTELSAGYIRPRFSPPRSGRVSGERSTRESGPRLCPFSLLTRCLNGFLAANMADDAMRLPTTVVASVLDGLSDADARRRDANLAAAPPPRRRRRSPAVFRFVLATLRRACERPADGLLFDSFSLVHEDACPFGG